MGCFSIPTQKARKKMRDQSQLPECKPASLYDNKPTVLPHPREVEQGKYSRTLSTPFQFIDGGRSPSSMSPSIRKEPRALSAPGRVRMLDSYAHSTPTMTDYIQLPCSPLRSRIQPLSDPTLCQKADGKTFGGRPVRLPSPLPLTGHPLPIPSSSVCQTSSQNSSSANLPLSSSKCSTPSREGNGKLFGGLRVSSSLQPKPLPPPPDETKPVASSPRPFTFIELAAGCQNFSPACCIGDTGAGLVYRSWIINERNPKKKTEASVMQITTTTILQDSRNFLVEATKLSSVQHPHLCKLIGFCVEDTPQLKGNSMKNKVHILVYEYLPNGTADKLLYGRQEGAPLNWSTRVKIALGAAKGLAYLHEHPSGQV
ncbi:hypothetical protein O6H91_01G098200 [Diphasiastrum complanatum]|uniref:Uncharacterized protein n=1 Tax=Diphasiastrum complanatum TaxID=34168 RepID=A0ACC2ETU0_DIPCM|nr:hypothetical protein O6H91_01G098200 [Diphasiastrum complanatum]